MLPENTKEYKGKIITESEYYYGRKPTYWDKMYYWDAVEDRRNRARDIYYKMVTKDIKNQKDQNPLTYEESVRQHKVKKAFDDTQRLLDERNNLA